ncbi:hypothetical protein [Synechococcus sp. CS-1328]|uniref:hypothetical protein n=1 Tax=Synechococcus sp. CS-1328 TaxID=2847976 RepID=UPI00223A7167|nr:hypothetical protein [Synechococcus sp. CS-1328]MCT0226425.1 hypothetical protein [Synechococcus sp. CS-1328]
MNHALWQRASRRCLLLIDRLPSLARPSWVRPRLPRPPLRITALTLLLLIAVPVWQLQRQPRPRAQGLERVMALAALIQSFAATPQRPVPALWQQRLGKPLAERVWRQQRTPWWQLWSRNGEGGAVLALPAAALAGVPPASRPAQALVVDDLLLLAPDPLTRQWLSQQLSSRPRTLRGLEQVCRQRLETSQAVFWTPTALAEIAGPLAPLLQRFQEGCLNLNLAGAGLAWTGEAAAATGLLSGPGSALASSAKAAAAAPLASDVLLELRGSSLDLVLQSLLARQLIRDPLAARYGLGPAQLPLLRQAPFRLRVRPLAKGPFQAALELQLAVGSDRKDWIAILSALRSALEEQGLQAVTVATADPLPTATWTREDGVVIGGWRWLSVRGAPPELQFFLGPLPKTPVQEPPLAQALPPVASRITQLSLRLQPAELEGRGLLPPALPAVIRSARRLEVTALADQAGRNPDPLSLLTGRLDLNP